MPGRWHGQNLSFTIFVILTHFSLFLGLFLYQQACYCFSFVNWPGTNKHARALIHKNNRNYNMNFMIKNISLLPIYETKYETIIIETSGMVSFPGTVSKDNLKVLMDLFSQVQVFQYHYWYMCSSKKLQNNP